MLTAGEPVPAKSPDPAWPCDPTALWRQVADLLAPAFPVDDNLIERTWANTRTDFSPQITARAFTLHDDDLELDAADLPGFDLGFVDAGNKGFEAVGWDTRSSSLMLGKERSPMGLFSLPFPGEDGAAGVMQPFNYDSLGVRDISSLSIDARTGHALVAGLSARRLRFRQ